MNQPNIWLHLRSGLWILQNHGVPHDGLFSQYSYMPWIDANWGFDLLLGSAYRFIGLRALPVALMAYQVAVAIMLFWLGRGSRRNFWAPLLLTAVAQFTLWNSPIELMNSILLLGLELGLLYRARQAGSIKPLFWLAPLFIAWVNLDAHFVFGVLVLVLFLAANLIENACRRLRLPWFDDRTPTLPLSKMAAIVAGCFVATMISPYGIDTYRSWAVLVRDRAFVPYLTELRSIGFRSPQDFVLLALTMTAFFALGRQQSRDLFKIGLLLVSAALSFSMQRESWIAAVVAVALIGDSYAERPHDELQEAANSRLRWPALGLAALVTAILGIAIGTCIPANRDALLARVGKVFPVKACDYIVAHHLPAPLFNTYEWGGFLAWYLPDYPVAIDARNALYGEETNLRYFKITRGEMPLGEEPHFAQAGTVIVPVNSPLAPALSAGPRFTPVYRDDVGLVLVRTALLPLP